MTITVAEHTEHPFAKGDLTTNGIQWSAEVDTTTPDTDVAVEAVIIRPPALGEVMEMEVGLTAAFRAVSSATADITYKWQARNKGGAWANLHTPVTKADIGTDYVEETMSGRLTVQDGLDTLPLEVRLVMQCNESTQGRAKVKNSSYIRVKYAAS